MSSRTIVYDPESILFNLYSWFHHNFTYNVTKMEDDCEQLKFDAFLKWLGDGFRTFKMHKNQCLSEFFKTTIQGGNYKLDLNRNVFVAFPQKLNHFITNQMYGTWVDNDLYLNRDQFAESVGLESLFRNFSANKQIKLFNSVVVENSCKIENFFEKLSVDERANLIKKTTKINQTYPENLDFFIFVIKVLQYFEQSHCHQMWLQTLKNMISGENNCNEIFSNNLKFVDSCVDRKTFAHILLLSSKNCCIFKKFQIKWHLIFPREENLNIVLL
jgi:hypothetical protein